MPLTEVDDLIVRIEHDPDNIVLSAMLVDELVESRGMHRWEAMMHVHRVQTAARDMRDIDFTTRLISAKGPAFQALVFEVRRVVGMYEHETFTLFVVAGDDPPRVAQASTEIPQGAIFHGYAIALPATWVKEWHTRMSLKSFLPGGIDVRFSYNQRPFPKRTRRSGR